ncbi:hypothetical protein F5I97DRAFT_1220111 [Phlebopus sp. FC_14]|nr:hypothetical protein F5I97DRAFT_1220111 [Phlebopus sp. FC_14]
MFIAARERWIRMTFPKFSSRVRGGKQPDVVPPPHTMYNRGRCTLEIGPHVFPDTTIFEVHYHPAQVPAPSSAAFVYQAATSAPWQPATQSTTTTGPRQQSESSSAPSSIPASTQSSQSFLTFPSAGTIAPALISQVNTEANSNPTLANLLQLAAVGKASPDQLKTLGVLIQSLANSTAMTTDVTSPQPNISRPGSVSTTAHVAGPLSLPSYFHTPTREFDLVLEFKEAPSDRWLLPRGPAICEFTPTTTASGTIGNIMLSTVIPFTTPSSVPDAAGSDKPPVPDSIPKETVTFQFNMASSYVWESISRWAGSQDKLEENRKILADTKPPEQKFLAHRLPDGSQLTQMQNAAVHSFASKPIKPAINGTRPKRRSTSRKSLQDADAPSSPTAKRKRQSQPKTQTVPTPIACFSCGQTDVPLILGGRYCRPCVEAGLAREIPKVGGIGSYKLAAGNESERPRNNPHTEELSTGDQAISQPVQKCGS